MIKTISSVNRGKKSVKLDICEKDVETKKKELIQEYTNEKIIK